MKKIRVPRSMYLMYINENVETPWQILWRLRLIVEPPCPVRLFQLFGVNFSRRSVRGQWPRRPLEAPDMRAQKRSLKKQRRSAVEAN
jgi:hypothetical protein